MRTVKVAAIQMGCSWNIEENIGKADALVREAASKGAKIILLPELFMIRYLCQKEKLEFFVYATEAEENPGIRHFASVAKELNVVLPISFFEKKNAVRYNSVAVINADGEVSGIYRKTHLPDSAGYREKFYFTPGNTGFKVWNTRYAKIGVGICWDLWFVESSRSMAVMGAEIIFYPNAIGSDPYAEHIDTKDMWQLCMQGQALSNVTPIVAANRVGVENLDDSKIVFYGSSFISDYMGGKVAEADRVSETVLVAEFNLDEIEILKAASGLFKDRRPEMYSPIMTLDGGQQVKIQVKGTGLL